MQRTAAASIAIAIIAGIYLLTIVEGEMFRDYHGLDVAQRKDILQAIGAQASGSVDVPRYLRTIIVPAAKTVVDKYALTNPWNVTQEQIKESYYDELTNRITHNYSLVLDYDRNTSDPANEMYVSQQNLSLTKFNSSTDRFDLLQNRTTMFYPQRIKDVRGYMFTGRYEVGMPWGNESVGQYNYSIGIPNNIDELVVATREVWNRSVEDYYNMSEIFNRTNGGWRIATDYLNKTYDSTEDYSPGNGLEAGPYPSGDVGWDESTGWDHNSIVFYGWKKASERYPYNQMSADVQNDSVEISNRIVAHTWNYANITFSPPDWNGPSYGNFTNINGERKEIIEWGLSGTSIGRVTDGYDEALNGLNSTI